MFTHAPRFRPFLGQASRLLLCLCCCGMVAAAFGQSQSVITLVPANQVAAAVPGNAEDLQAVAIQLSGRASFNSAAALRMQLTAQHYVDLQITAASTYLNGDRMLRAQGSVEGVMYSLALTVGDEQLFGHLSSAGGSWQLVATGAGNQFSGWLYRPLGLTGAADSLRNDFMYPDHTRVPAPALQTAPRLPLTLGNAATTTASANAASGTVVTADNLRLTQTFDHRSVLVGGIVTTSLRFENIGTSNLKNLYVEVYFLLENSELKSAPESCRKQLSLSSQMVLYCELGDFAPGQVKSVAYSIAATEQSRPQITSTPVVGSVRLDGTINVVSDVRSDSDGDGVSDFNENLVGTDPANADSVTSGDTVIDVMALYTPDARAAYPLGVETRINQLISVANQVYADSGVGIELRPVYQGEVDYNDSVDMDTALDAIIYKTSPAFANVNALRAQYGADLVMLLRPLGEDRDRCGLAPVGGYSRSGDFSAATEKQFAYAYIAIDCPSDIVVAHELGHNMGLTHSYREDGEGGTFEFSTGFGEDGQFATVMAQPAAFHASTRVAQFSNPQLECLGFVCGVDEGLPMPADAAQSLNIARFQIADYFPTTVPDLPANAVATFSGQPTDARIALAASHDNGLSFDGAVTPEDRVDVLAEIKVDSSHIGMAGNIYVLVAAADGQVFQVSAEAGVSLWNGASDTLMPVVTNVTLHKLERFSLLQDLRIDPALVGQQFQLYIAYEVSATGELVYTATPLVMTVQAAH